MKKPHIVYAVIFTFLLISCTGTENNPAPPTIDEMAGQPKSKSRWGSLTGKIPNNIGNAITGDPKTTRTITWQSTNNSGEVIIGITHYPSTTKKEGNYYFHRVNITELEPGDTYRYIAGSSGFYSPVYSFKTENADNDNTGEFYVLHVTDPQIGADRINGDAEVWKRVIESAVAQCPDAAFVINTGDIVEDGIETAIPFYFDYAQETIANYAFVYSMGNNDQTSWYNKYFYTPGTSGILYSFDYGDVHFVNFDSNVGELTNAQMSWLEHDLANTAKKWKVAMTHEADYGRSGENTAITKLLDTYNVDLVLAGHNHFYGRTKPIDTAGNVKTNGTVWSIPNTAGTKFNLISSSGQNYLAVNQQPYLPMFSVLQFTETNIYLNAYTVNTTGAVVPYDSYTFR